MKLLFTLFILFYFIVDFVSQIDETYDLTNGTYKAFCLLSCPLGPSLRVIFYFLRLWLKCPANFHVKNWLFVVYFLYCGLVEGLKT